MQKFTLLLSKKGSQLVCIYFLENFHHFIFGFHKVAALVTFDLVNTPRIALKQCRPLMKASVDKSLSMSICIAREQDQVRRRPFLLCISHPCLIRNGPKPSILQYVNGCDRSTCTGGMSAILCSSVGLLSLLQFML